MNKSKSKYIMLKVSGNWIEQEHAVGRMKFLLVGVPNVEFADEAIEKHSAWLSIPNTPLTSKERTKYETSVKMELARSLGVQLLKDGLIDFAKEEGDFADKITATVKVIREDEP